MIIKQVYKTFSEMRYLREDMINKFIFKIMGVNMEGKPKNIRGVVTIRSN